MGSIGMLRLCDAHTFIVRISLNKIRSTKQIHSIKFDPMLAIHVNIIGDLIYPP